MLLINDDNKLDTVLMCLFDFLEEVFSFAILEGVILLSGYKLPVDEGNASALKAAQHGIRQRTGVDMRCKRIHTILALLLQITLAGTEPDESCLAVSILQICIYILYQNNCLACSGRRFDSDDLFCAGGSGLVVEEINAVLLKFVVFDSVYHISPASLNSKSK